MAQNPPESTVKDTSNTKDLSQPILDSEQTKLSNDSKIPPNSTIRESSPHGRYVKLDSRLGSGAYKDVWRAYDTNEGIQVAWNVVKLSRVPPSERKRIKTEVTLLRDIEHKNVIKYYNSWVDREKEQIIFITEIMSSGSLKDYLRKNPIIRWNAVKRWCRQILHGLEFLHANKIIHRDIKCDNIFINGTTGDLRIGDLGLSTRIAEERSSNTQSSIESNDRQITAATMTCLGTPEFMAPELYEESYTDKVDVYAFGMAMIEMVTGLLPYHECTSAAQIYKKVLNGEFPPELDLITRSHPRAYEFIHMCLLPQDLRPSASELLANDFLLPNEEEDYKEVRVKLSGFSSTLPMISESPNMNDDSDEDDENGNGNGNGNDYRNDYRNDFGGKEDDSHNDDASGNGEYVNKEDEVKDEEKDDDDDIKSDEDMSELTKISLDTKMASSTTNVPIITVNYSHENNSEQQPQQQYQEQKQSSGRFTPIIPKIDTNIPPSGHTSGTKSGNSSPRSRLPSISKPESPRQEVIVSDMKSFHHEKGNEDSMVNGNLTYESQNVNKQPFPLHILTSDVNVTNGKDQCSDNKQVSGESSLQNISRGNSYGSISERESLSGSNRTSRTLLRRKYVQGSGSSNTNSGSGSSHNNSGSSNNSSNSNHNIGNLSESQTMGTESTSSITKITKSVHDVVVSTSYRAQSTDMLMNNQTNIQLSASSLNQIPSPISSNRSSVVLTDVVDHTENPNILVFHLRLSASEKVSSPSFESLPQVEVEFDFDLLLDDCEVIAEEMIHHPDVDQLQLDKTQVLTIFQPFVDSSKRLISTAQLSSGSDINTSIVISNLAKAVLQDIISNRIGDNNLLRKLRDRSDGMTTNTTVNTTTNVSNTSNTTNNTNSNEQHVFSSFVDSSVLVTPVRSTQLPYDGIPYSEVNMNVNNMNNSLNANNAVTTPDTMHQNHIQSQLYPSMIPSNGMSMSYHSIHPSMIGSANNRSSILNSNQIAGGYFVDSTPTASWGSYVNMNLSTSGQPHLSQYRTSQYGNVSDGSNLQSDIAMERNFAIDNMNFDEIEVEVDITDEELENDEEFKEITLKYNATLQRIEKDYNQRNFVIQSQKKSLEETYKKKRDELLSRREDLIDQLNVMQNKFKERMNEIEERKRQLEEALLGKRKMDATGGYEIVDGKIVTPIRDMLFATSTSDPSLGDNPSLGDSSSSMDNPSMTTSPRERTQSENTSSKS